MRKKITLFIALVCFTLSFCFAQDVTVKGTIKDKSGEPIPGISVKVKNSKSAVSSGADGSFSITAPGTGTLIFSAVGYTTQ